MNRREKPRFGVRLHVVVVAERLGVRHPVSLVTRNISETGLYIYGTPEDFAVGPHETHLELTLILDDGEGELQMIGEIMHRRCEPPQTGFGLKIVKISDHGRERLTRFIASYGAAHPETLET